MALQPLLAAMLRGLSIEHAANGSESAAGLDLYAGQSATFTLRLAKAGRLPAWQVRGWKTARRPQRAPTSLHRHYHPLSSTN